MFYKQYASFDVYQRDVKYKKGKVLLNNNKFQLPFVGDFLTFIIVCNIFGIIVA